MLLVQPVEIKFRFTDAQGVAKIFIKGGRGNLPQACRNNVAHLHKIKAQPQGTVKEELDLTGDVDAEIGNTFKVDGYDMGGAYQVNGRLVRLLGAVHG